MNDRDRMALARIISKLHEKPEPDKDFFESVLGDYLHVSPDAHVIGVTGIWGSGKSTLINRILSVLSGDGWGVVVLAIDPTSEKTGGALLADRIRMRDHYLDEKIFIRSLATRGEKAGITASLKNIIDASRRFCDFVIVETAGTGQVDTGIRNLVQSLVLVLPSLGDSLTFMKSGQTDFAHFVVFNSRGNNDGDFRRYGEAASVLGGEIMEDGWQRKVYPVDAEKNKGVEEFVRNGIYAHRNYLVSKKSPSD